MAQHFLLSAEARPLSAAKILRMSDAEVDATFRWLRWPETGGQPVCPRCDCKVFYSCHRPGGQTRWRCKACRHDFSMTSGTIFASHKLPLRTYLHGVLIFCNEVKGKSMVAFSRELDVQYKTAFVLAHKLREAMASGMKCLLLGGIGQTVEVDGAYVGGYVRPTNRASNRVDRRRAENRSGKRKVVVAMRERGGRIVTQVFSEEGDAVPTIRRRVLKGTTVCADENPAWNQLHATFSVQRINHQDGYSLDGIHINNAESFFSRLRRGEAGHHHHFAGPYLIRYAQEAAWREDARRISNGDQVNAVIKLSMHTKPSIDFCGYWQRARAA